MRVIKMTKIIQWYVNGDKVTQEVFEREAQDNFNVGIDFNVCLVGYSLYMTYATECELCTLPATHTIQAMPPVGRVTGWCDTHYNLEVKRLKIRADS